MVYFKAEDMIRTRPTVERFTDDQYRQIGEGIAKANYAYERPGPDWICSTCGEGPDRCQMVSEGEMMYPRPSD